MKYYVGLDVSMKETFVCVIDENQKKICEKSIKTDPETLANFLHGLKLSIELVGLESGSLSHWLTSELLRHGLPVKCIDARHIAAVLSVKINKTDKNDARGIANAMRCNLFREVTIKSKEILSLGTLLNSRKLLVDQKMQLVGTIRGMFKPYGICLGTLSKGMKCIEKICEQCLHLPEEAKYGISHLVTVLKEMISSIKDFDKRINKIVASNTSAKVLMSAPGIGPITSLRYLAEVHDPTRFKKSKSVGAYIGMTPRQYSSGETERYGRISKCGSKELRTLLMEAGIVILMRTHSWSKLKAWGLRIYRKKGLKKAATAVGRKLSVILHHMLMTGESFQFTDKKTNESLKKNKKQVA